MEFGIFIQGYVPQFRARSDADAEHHALMNELELVQRRRRRRLQVRVAHRAPLPRRVLAPVGERGRARRTSRDATERIHLGSGIFNPLPQVNHPAKVAEQVAMLDHLSEGRFEFGTGRGAGSHEILGFLPEMSDLSGTREIWEDVIGEFPKMWLQETYEGYEGKYWSLPPRKILPKPFVKPHPPMWYAAGNTSSYEMARAQGPRRPRVLDADDRGDGGGHDGVQDADPRRRAGRRVRERQHHDHDRRVCRRGPSTRR